MLPSKTNFLHQNLQGLAFLRPLTKGGVRQSVLTLTSTAVGGGLLTLPYAMSLTGWGLGLVILLLGAVASVWGIEQLMTNAIETGVRLFC